MDVGSRERCDMSAGGTLGVGVVSGQGRGQGKIRGCGPRHLRMSLESDREAMNDIGGRPDT